MQTFLPYRDFGTTAQCLDRNRLGNQRIEAKMILKILLGHTEGGKWRHHPVVRMWAGYERALAVYGLNMCQEWMRRGYVDNQRRWFKDRLKKPIPHIEWPPWIGHPELHASHRSNLLRKNPLWYRKFNWTEPDTLTYYWPVKAHEKVLL